MMMSRPSVFDELARPSQPLRAFRAYAGNRVLFTVHGRNEQHALEAVMKRCLDEGIGYLDDLHCCEATAT
jgi:hypothetical protein